MQEATFEAAFDTAVTTAQSEQSKDQAAPAKADQAEAATPTTEEKGTEPAQLPEGSEELLPQGEWDKLQGDPKALRAALNKAFTEKSQKLSEERKANQSALEQYQGLNKAWEANPKELVRVLAKQAGIELPSVETKAEAKVAAKTMVDELKESLGPELEFLAERLGPTLEKAVLRIAQQTVEPLRQQADALTNEQISKDVDADLARMTEKFPDWKKHEQKMYEIGQSLLPAKNPSTGKYPTNLEHLERLYHLATVDVREADRTRKTIERIEKAAEKAEPTESGVAPSRVAKSAPKSGNFNEKFENAFADARAGVRYE